MDRIKGQVLRLDDPHPESVQLKAEKGSEFFQTGSWGIDKKKKFTPTFFGNRRNGMDARRSTFHQAINEIGQTFTRNVICIDNDKHVSPLFFRFRFLLKKEGARRPPPNNAS
jgi:hypothetical protein